MEVVLRSLQDPRWSSFVETHRSALPFHHPSWAAMLAECYGFRAFCMTIDDLDGRIVAGLPVLEIGRPRSRPKWVSLPFTDSCPPLTTGGAGMDLARLLDDARRGFGVHRLEMRGDVEGLSARSGAMFVTHELPLTGSEDDVFATFHASQVRRNIRRAERSGVTVRLASMESDLTEVFYRLHTRTRHRLGVPIQPHRYFRLLWRRVVQPGLGVVMVAEVAGEPVAAGVFLASGGVCVYKYGASDERRWSARPNHLLFWEAIRWALARGCRTFDFGRTHLTDTTLRDFKSRWGTVERELAYTVLTDVPSRAGGRGLPPSLRWAIRHGPMVVPRVAGELLYRFTA